MINPETWKIGDILITAEQDSPEEAEYWIVFTILAFEGAVPVGEDLAVCDTKEKAELVAGLLIAYTMSGRKLPSVQDMLTKN